MRVDRGRHLHDAGGRRRTGHADDANHLCAEMLRVTCAATRKKHCDVRINSNKVLK